MNFNRYITEAEFSELAAFIRREGVVRRFARGERLSGQGLRSHRCGLVVQGAFRYVYADAAGEEHVVGYAFAGEFVGDYISMCVDAPSQVTIGAMCGAEALTERCPDVLQLVPLRELASYLGVRPETLSRIRRRVR